jgi:antirestriction protein
MEDKMGEVKAITINETPRIYVACLAAYNCGYLHGRWIDAAQDAWAIYDDVKAMLAASPIAGSEEWAIHDYEGFGTIRISEYASFDHVSGLAAFIAEHGELGSAVLDYHNGDLEEARETLEDRYLGSYASLADYAQEVTEVSTAIPQRLAYYIDWQAMARDAELSGDVFTVQTAWDSVHVFVGC